MNKLPTAEQIQHELPWLAAVADEPAAEGHRFHRRVLIVGLGLIAADHRAGRPVEEFLRLDGPVQQLLFFHLF